MAKYVNPTVFNSGGLGYISTNCTKMVLLKSYTQGNDYTTVNTTNNIAEVAFTSADFQALTGTYNRTLTTSATQKSAVSTVGSGGSPNLHIAFVSGSEVLWVTDETSDQVIGAGNTVNFPTALTLTLNQPT
jgi:hypothetical protein